MRATLWIVFACLSSVTAMYRFRFHTCIREDQNVLSEENLISLNQVAFIDDGSLSYHNVTQLERIGIKIEGGAALAKLTSSYESGGESAHRVISFRGSDKFIVINFWTLSYHLVKKNAVYSLSEPVNAIKPDLGHFVRVYFICAPGNSRSALILFGPQAKLRSTRDDGIGEKRAARNASTVQVKVTEQWTEKMTERDRLRMTHRARLRWKLNLSFLLVGFAMATVINGSILIVLLMTFKEGNKLKRDEKPALASKASDPSGRNK